MIGTGAPQKTSEKGCMSHLPSGRCMYLCRKKQRVDDHILQGSVNAMPVPKHPVISSNVEWVSDGPCMARYSTSTLVKLVYLCTCTSGQYINTNRIQRHNHRFDKSNSGCGRTPRRQSSTLHSILLTRGCGVCMSVYAAPWVAAKNSKLDV
jgi:hypothetical protein